MINFYNSLKTRLLARKKIKILTKKLKYFHFGKMQKKMFLVSMFFLREKKDVRCIYFIKIQIQLL